MQRVLHYLDSIHVASEAAQAASKIVVDTTVYDATLEHSIFNH